jgi:hypothetical protein
MLRLCKKNILLDKCWGYVAVLVHQSNTGQNPLNVLCYGSTILYMDI